MTSEILVMNKHAVAMAADSAVTMRNQHGQKIFNTTNKLFALSKYYPVGIMTYGNAEFCGVPFEVLIKTYRQKYLRDNKFDKLKDYAQHFIKFLSAKHTFFNEDNEAQRYRLKNLMSYLKKKADEQVQDYINKKGKITIDEIQKIVYLAIANYHKNFKKNTKESTLTKSDAEEFLSTFPILEEYLNIFKIPHTEKILNELKKLLLTVVININPNFLSGIVIAGYGEDEIFPSYVSYEIDGVINGKLKYRVADEGSVTKFTTGVIPFAQADVIVSFISGIDPNLEKMIERYWKNSLENSIQTIINFIENESDENTKNNIAKSLKEFNKVMLEKFKNNMLKYKKEQLINPLLEAVSALPKDELAFMAETLVSITSFKRKFSMSSETVGGPVDIAVISKGDGFIWVKRKHYFDKEYNYAFFHNYFRSEENEKGGSS